MELIYDGALVLPKNYVTMGEEEMEYLEGGVSWKKNAVGYKITLSARDCSDLAALAAGGSITGGSVSAVLGLTGVGIPGAIALAVLSGVAGVGSSYLWLCSNHNGATMQMFYAGGLYLGMTPPVIKW